MDSDSTFSIGLICGPSGCGKSSLVKAGLLPRLAENVIAVYVEATGQDTETRLVTGLETPSVPAREPRFEGFARVVATRPGHSAFRRRC